MDIALLLGLVLAFAISLLLTLIEIVDAFWKARSDLFRRSSWFYAYVVLNGLVATAVCYGTIQVVSLPEWLTGILVGTGWQSLLRSNFFLPGQSKSLTLPQGLTTEQEVRKILSGKGLEKVYLAIAGFFTRLINEDLKITGSQLLGELRDYVPSQEIATKIETLVLSSHGLDEEAKMTIITKVKAQLNDPNTSELDKRMYLGATLMTYGSHGAARKLIKRVKLLPPP